MAGYYCLLLLGQKSNLSIYFKFEPITTNQICCKNIINIASFIKLLYKRKVVFIFIRLIFFFSLSVCLIFLLLFLQDLYFQWQLSLDRAETHFQLRLCQNQQGRAMFMEPINTKIFIKIVSYDTIYTFKNYFTTVFSIVFSNKQYPNIPIVSSNIIFYFDL